MKTYHVGIVQMTEGGNQKLKAGRQRARVRQAPDDWLVLVGARDATILLASSEIKNTHMENVFVGSTRD